MNQEINNDEKEELAEAVVQLQSAWSDKKFDQLTLKTILLYVVPDMEEEEAKQYIQDESQRHLKDSTTLPHLAVATIAKLAKDHKTVEKVLKAVEERKNSVQNHETNNDGSPVLLRRCTWLDPRPLINSLNFFKRHDLFLPREMEKEDLECNISVGDTVSRVVEINQGDPDNLSHSDLSGEENTASRTTNNDETKEENLESDTRVSSLLGGPTRLANAAGTADADVLDDNNQDLDNESPVSEEIGQDNGREIVVDDNNQGIDNGSMSYSDESGRRSYSEGSASSLLGGLTRSTVETADTTKE